MKYLFLLILMSIFIPITFAQVCTDGEERPCMNTLGICAEGIQICFNGVWGVCSIRPFERDICLNGKDDNCNGIIDENCICEEGETESCGSDVGVCEKGIRMCVNGKWTECEGNIEPQQEDCSNTIDDDCDGFCDDLYSLCVDQTVPGDDECAIVNLCDDRIQNFDEEGIDCGGSCPLCPSCTDEILNQGEEKVNQILVSGTAGDCGGPSCPPCPTCFDGIQNQNEEGIDCGGSCSNCKQEQTPQENFICGNNLCEEPETVSLCPEDCTPKSGFFTLVFIFMIIIGVISCSFFLYLKIINKKKQKETPTFRIHPSLLRMTPKNHRTEKITEEIKKIK